MEGFCKEISLKLMKIKPSDNIGNTDNFFILMGKVVHDNLNQYNLDAHEEVFYQRGLIGYDGHERSWYSESELLELELLYTAKFN